MRTRASQSLPSMRSCNPPSGRASAVRFRSLATGTSLLFASSSSVVERVTPLVVMVALPRLGTPRAWPAKSSAWLHGGWGVWRRRGQGGGGWKVGGYRRALVVWLCASFQGGGARAR